MLSTTITLHKFYNYPDIVLYITYAAERFAFISLLILIKTASYWQTMQWQPKFFFCFTGDIFLCGNVDRISVKKIQGEKTACEEQVLFHILVFRDGDYTDFSRLTCDAQQPDG